MLKTKTVYQTDPNGLYLYPVEANELALAEGLFNVPYGAHEDQPPAASAGFVVARIGGAWELAEDYREVGLWLVATGESYVPGNEAVVDGVKVSYPGWGVLPAWLTQVETTPSPAEASA